MVGVYGVAGDDDEDADDEEQTVDDCPPCKRREAIAFGGLNLRDYARDEGDVPCELWDNESVGMKKGPAFTHVHAAVCGGGKPTSEMEIVARAKGSPRMLPKRTPLRP